MSLTLTKEHLSDREQQELKKCILQHFIVKPPVKFYPGLQIADQYFVFLVVNKNLRLYRFGWRLILHLNPLPNFAIQYFKHQSICK